MEERDVSVCNSLGIHARPASMIVQTAQRFRSNIELEKDGLSADAKSIMNVMMLAAAEGSRVRIRAEGKDEGEAVEAIAHLFESRFNEK